MKENVQLRTMANYYAKGLNIERFKGQHPRKYFLKYHLRGDQIKVSIQDLMILIRVWLCFTLNYQGHSLLVFPYDFYYTYYLF